MKNVLILVTASLLFASCKEIASPAGNTYYFNAPQPVNDSELHSIPNKYLGFYVNADSIYLNVSKKMITQERFFKFRIHKNNLDSIADKIVRFKGKYRFKNETTFLEDKIIGDSIEFSQKEIDTFFIFSDIQKAKRIRGKLVLNKKEAIYWQTNLVALTDKELVVKYLYSDDDLKKMDSITIIKAKQLDSTSYLITPSRAEFSQFFEIKNFGYETKFKKIAK